MQRRSYVANFVILIGLMLTACAPKAPPAAATTAPLVSAPQLGSTMAWVDGSTLVYIPMPVAREDSSCDPSGLCNARLDIRPSGLQPQAGAGGGVWLTENPISKYQFSLCVQAGDCQNPSSSDPAGVFVPIDDVGPEGSPAYCGWIGGRLPTDAEMAAMGDGSVRTALGGIDLTGGVHCLVDNPRPRPMYSQTSPYYDLSTSMAKMLAQPAGNETFCQGDKSYATLDLAVPPDHSIESVTGDGNTQCSLLEGGRILCGGDAGSSPQVEVGVQCTAQGVFGRQPGSELVNAVYSNNIHAEAIAGMDDWEMDSNGALVPVSLQQLPDGAWTGPITQPMHLINGVMVVQTLSGNTMSSNNLAGNNLAGNGLASNNLAGNGLATNDLSSSGLSSEGAAGNGAPEIGELLPAVCPVGFYSDSSAASCTSLGPSEPICLDGFSFDAPTKTCRSEQPDGNYPGCPAGKLFDPSTGACDAHTQVVSATQLIHTQSFQFNLPDCTRSREKDPSRDQGCVQDAYTKCP